MSERLAALRASSDHLHALVTALGPDELRRPAYPSGWTVADALSHLGSSAAIFGERFTAAVAGRRPVGDPQPTWDAWNAKSPEAKAADALVADRQFVDALETLPDADRADLRLALGPLEVDFEGYVGLRLNEHTVHTWDIEVVGNRDATLLPAAVPFVVDALGLVAQYTGKPDGGGDVRVHTTGPRRDLILSVAGSGVALAPSEDAAHPDVILPAEALVRLVYGRLDPDHTPDVSDAAVVHRLRAVFPGPLTRRRFRSGG